MMRPHDLPAEASETIPLAELWAKLVAENGRQLPNGQYEVEYTLRDQVARGELLLWGREGSPVAPFRMIPCTAGNHIFFDTKWGGEAVFDGGPIFYDCWIGPPAASSMPTTGAPGRPSSMYLVRAEHERRVRDGEASRVSRQDEATTLEQWLRITHPNMPPAKATTIKNKLPKTFQPMQGKLKVG